MPLSSPPCARSSDEAARLQAAIAQTAGVPFYEASAWQAAFGDHSLKLAELPRITKSQLREHSPEGFLAAGQTVESLLAHGLIEEESTSGTSASRLMFEASWCRVPPAERMERRGRWLSIVIVGCVGPRSLPVRHREWHGVKAGGAA